MTRTALLAAVVATIGLQAATAEAQRGPSGDAVREGEFQRRFSEASSVLEGIQQNRTLVYSLLPQSSMGHLNSDVPQLLVARLRDSGSAASAPGLPADATRVIDRARQLQRRLLDIYSDPEQANRAELAERAIDEYVAEPATALASQPKGEISPVPDGPHRHGGGRAGTHAHHGQAHAHAGHSFSESNPEVNRILWAQHWLENALFEPLMLFRTQEEQQAGVRQTIDRFQSLLMGGSGALPSRFPTTAAVTPELTLRHPRAAVILNHLHMLENTLLDVIAATPASERDTAVRSILQAFIDPDYRTITEVDWIRMSLRSGIFFQGGPALGRMERSDRNAASMFYQEGHESHVILPGMGPPRP
jgi:hypothetical protein